MDFAGYYTVHGPYITDKEYIAIPMLWAAVMYFKTFVEYIQGEL